MNQRATLLILALVSSLLGACGGGTPAVPDVVVATPSPATSASAPAPSAKPCLLFPITVQAFGDSTQISAYEGNWLQSDMDRQFGVGRIKVVLRAVAGTTASQMTQGLDGLNSYWPQSFTAPIAIENFGLNEQRIGISMSEFRSSILTLASGPGLMILQTPNPVRPPVAPNDAWADVVREVAASTGAPLADAHQYVLGIADWQSKMLDDIHPGPAIRQAVALNVTAPALAKAISDSACK